KRVFNYPEALANLDQAYKHGANTEQNKEAEIRVLVEKALISFDSQKYGELNTYLEQIKGKNLDLLNPESRAFYFNILAVLDIRSGNYQKADSILLQGIDILSKQSPKHLPLVYSKLIGLSDHTKDKKKAQDAFEKGMYYANKYNIDLYKIVLLNAMRNFCLVTEDYKAASKYEKEEVVLSSEYNAPFENGKLTVLEKELLATRKNVEIQYGNKIRIILIVLSVISLALITVLFRLMKVSKQRNALLEKELLLMRHELEKLASETNEQGETQLELNNYNFTSRQLEIIALIKQGKTNKEIGNELFISENTVKYHLKTIYGLLGIDRRADLLTST
ncbi:MAG: LuxR C-terminal-related transcriptional regulator, partial [Sphingobacterium sp.]|nr:LuxR C-terminal-related transcriptional regulator [Sphingobacterium sp.]